MQSTLIQWEQQTQEISQLFAERAKQSDQDGRFVFENYNDLKANQYFSAAIPEELGGGGASHAEMCNMIRIISHHCSSTALAFSMHQHLVAATIWRYKNKGEGVPMLKKVVADQLVLVSTGARDWLESNGEMIRTEGGYLFSGKKHFASGSVIGDIAVTSAPYFHPNDGWQVLHFAVPMRSEGVSVLDDWDVMGMRASGSQTIVFDKTPIPDSSIILARPRNGYHQVWDVVLTVALPLIMSAYVGIAEEAMEIALTIGQKYSRNQQHFPYIIGKMNNTLVSARTQWKQMIALCDNINFKPSETTTIEMLSLKTNVANDCISVVQQAMASIGGQSFYRKNTLERLFRDVQATQFHPLPEWDQYFFTGSRLLNEMSSE